ncbi:winged helix-turn-helix transcriptional regulator [Nocardia sp. NPDC052566]|uniref:winged helix-turn-helix transcriptional regulator n=1 Tax=Nocardia sp. NPDC052566 TaxID=3364330 RepID=UPI0037C634BF
MPVRSQVPYPVEQGTSDTFHPECSWRDIVDLTARWSGPILHALEEKALRFSELQGRIDGVSDKMLSQTLRALVRDGLVTRTVEPTMPPRVSYELTDLGRGLAESLQPFMDWIRRHAADVLAARQHHDQPD